MVEVVAFSLYYNDVETSNTINSDVKFIIFVLSAAFIYMVVHLKSLFLAFFSLVNLIMSVPITLCIYTYVLEIKYFSSIHFSAVLIILGIGADDIFVFHDQWKATFLIKAMDKKPMARLSYTLRLASSAMLATSLTSSIAFFACYFSPIMPLSSFGVFAGLLVLMDYLMTIAIQPIVYYIYEVVIMPS